MLKSAQRWLVVAALLFVLVVLFSSVVNPNIVSAGWKEDPVVTEVGKSAERARELLYWTMSHPAINRSQVISGLWAFSRNVVYVFFIIVIAMGGLGIVVSRRQGKTGPIFSGISSPFAGLTAGTLIMRIAALLVYATFSYVFVLGLIEFAQILQNFFIERLDGCKLFNINFGEATKCLPDSLAQYQETVAKMEKNYSGFVGYSFFDANGRNLEMINTSLFYIRLTTMTYNIMSYVMILRDVVLWFLMIIAPFLALMMPFTFIRNVGWIWIGVFLQWLFYGPLFTLFIGSIVKIWSQGIPYGFDFSRTPAGLTGNPDATTIQQALPFETSINILWGGPAQTLDQLNSANYIDTFAEYVVSIIMLWVAIMLPWLLLRIFRDYCCDILKQNQGTLKAIYGQLRSSTTPGKPPSTGDTSSPTGAVKQAMRLPFRKVQEEQLFHSLPRKSEESIKRSISIEKMSNIKKIQTNELSKNLNITVNKLQDLARIETSESYQKNVREQLDRIANPVAAITSQERQQYSQVRNELVTRAKQGDEAASRILQSASNPTISEFVVGAGKASAEQLISVAQKVGVTEQQVQKVAGVLPTISNLPRAQQISHVVKTSELTHNQVQNVVNNISQRQSSLSSTQIDQISESSQVSHEQVQNVASMISSTNTLSSVDQIKNIVEQTSLSEEKSSEVTQLIKETQASLTQSDFESISQATGVAAEQVKQIASIMPKVRELQQQDQWVNHETIEKIIEETRVTKEQAEEILDLLTTSRGRIELARIPHELPAAISVSQIKKAAEVAKVTETQVGQVVRMLPTIASMSPIKQIEQIAQEVDLSQEQAAQIVDTLVISKPVDMDQEEKSERVSVDDYEEVKSMWLNHYRNSSVPLSGKIKSRADWINEDSVRITNALNLLQSDKPEMKEEGLSEVEKILPFLLLGGFNNDETVVYMKAKLEAAKTVIEEVNSEAQKTAAIANEEEKVFVETGEVQEELAKTLKHTKERKLEVNIPIETPMASVVNLDPVLQKLDLTLQKLHDIAQLETDLAKRREVEEQMEELNIPHVQKDFEQVKAQVRKVTDDDLEDVKNLWIRYYREAPIPQDQGFMDRLSWIKSEISELRIVTQMLQAGTQEQYAQAQEQYGQYLQFVMLGEFALGDITSYLEVRLSAGEFVAKEQEMGGGGDVFQGQVQELVEKVESEPTDGIEPSTSVLPRLRSTN